jgi:FkbM family methyltransferase
VKMLYRTGFAMVYRVTPLPDHDDFRETNEHLRRRTVLVASDVPLDIAGFRLMTEPDAGEDPWAKRKARAGSLARRAVTFWRSSRRRKYLTIAFRLRRLFPEMPIPLRLRFGAWWLAQDSALDHALMHEEFEPAETRFVERFVRPGMTVVDAGAHHGLYTLLASKRVGRAGRVVAIEPSARERARLQRHLRVNRCPNVVVGECALGEREGWSQLHLVEGEHDWCNSLQMPNVNGETQTQAVQVCRLDVVAQALDIRQIDFLKLDVEGAELSVLQGMGRLLETNPRPVILAEVQDLRTAAWGYPARNILEFLQERGFCWFAVTNDGRLAPLPLESEEYDGNFVAVPEERLPECAELPA